MAPGEAGPLRTGAPPQNRLWRDSRTRVGVPPGATRLGPRQQMWEQMRGLWTRAPACGVQGWWPSPTERPAGRVHGPRCPRRWRLPEPSRGCQLVSLGLCVRRSHHRPNTGRAGALGRAGGKSGRGCPRAPPLQALAEGTAVPEGPGLRPRRTGAVGSRSELTRSVAPLLLRWVPPTRTRGGLRGCRRGRAPPGGAISGSRDWGSGPGAPPARSPAHPCAASTPYSFSSLCDSLFRRPGHRCRAGSRPGHLLRLLRSAPHGVFQVRTRGVWGLVQGPCTKDPVQCPRAGVRAQALGLQKPTR